MAKSPRPRTLAAGFGAFFVIVGFIAWTFVQNVSAPGWYPPDITRWVYSTYMILAGIFVVGLGGLGLSIRKSIAQRIRELDERTGMTREPMSEALPPPLPGRGVALQRRFHSGGGALVPRAVNRTHGGLRTAALSGTFWVALAPPLATSVGGASRMRTGGLGPCYMPADRCRTGGPRQQHAAGRAPARKGGGVVLGTGNGDKLSGSRLRMLS